MTESAQNQPGIYPKSGFSLSSWNYGSFYHCNPYYLQKEFLKANRDQGDREGQRSKSLTLNKYGKVVLKPEERIVNDDMLRTLHGLKTIKAENPNLRRNKTAKNLRTNTFNTNDLKSNTAENNNTKSMTKAEEKKNFKYQLTYDEWKAIKQKQEEILGKWKSENEKENKNLELINNKINEEYNQIKDEKYSKWKTKKKEELLRKKDFDRRIEEEKLRKQMEKEEERNNKLDDWFKKQAEKIEQEAYIKRLKAQSERDEKQRIEELKNEKKLKSSVAYNEWLRKKEHEKEKKFTTKSSKNATDKRRKTQEMYSTSKDEGQKTNPKFKISIGPYSTGKALRNIEKKLNSDFNVHSYYETQDKEKKTTKKKIDDSFQDLSSIKKDTPVNEGDGDDD